MTTQAGDPYHFIRRAQQITAQLPTLLFQWGLLPKFKHWRLVQDAETGMVVLFGVLDNQYITRHTTHQFNDYFDPQLLRDLETELHVRVISSSNDGIRYTFLLERGKPGTPKDIPAFPALPGTFIPGKCPFGTSGQEAQGLLCPPMPAVEATEYVTGEQVTPNDIQDELMETQIEPHQPNNSILGDNHSIMRQRLDKFLKTTVSLDAMNDAPTQSPPDVLFMDEAEFNLQMTKYEATPMYTQLAEEMHKDTTDEEGVAGEFPRLFREFTQNEEKFYNKEQENSAYH